MFLIVIIYCPLILLGDIMICEYSICMHTCLMFSVIRKTEINYALAKKSLLKERELVLHFYRKSTVNMVTTHSF